MARTILFRKLKKIAQRAICNSEEFSQSRRNFIVGGASALVAGALASGCSAVPVFGRSSSRNKQGPRVAIVGGGLAGLTCSYRLSEGGVLADIYEGSSRLGGRVFSIRNHFADGQVAELGGELIDSGHRTMFRLAEELGLAIDDLKKVEAGSDLSASGDAFVVEGRLLSEAEIEAAFIPLAKIMQQEATKADQNSDYYAQLDQQSILAWLDSKPVDSNLKKLLCLAYVGEFGLEVYEQSALNLIYFIDFNNTNPFRVFGDSDERFHIRGGNDLLASTLASRIESDIHTQHELLAISGEGSSGYNLTFKNGLNTFDRRYDFVVLAIPFTKLRQIDTAKLNWPGDKQQVIRELGYGTNTKLMGGFKERAWLKKFPNLSMIADEPIQTVWETSREQKGNAGIITNFLGGMRGLQAGAGSAEDQYKIFLNAAEPYMPGLSSAYQKGSAVRMHWPSYPWVGASYACYKVGQSGFSGVEGRREGNVLFCGEHCSIEYQGFMEGAAETGESAAYQILREIPA